jgi:hypothetical protein
MRESALFGTMFGLGAGAVLVGVTVSRLVVGQAPEKPAEEPPAAVVEATPRAAAVEPAPVIVKPGPPAAMQSSPPPDVSSVAPPAEVALSGQHRVLPRKHLRAPAVQEAAPKPAPVVEPAPSATGSIANHEAPTASPKPSVQVDDPPIARDAPGASDGPITIVRGGVARPASRAPGAHVIQVEPQGQ